MFEKKDKHEHAETADAPAAAPTDPHMTRAEFMQHLHHTLDQYAEHWDQGRADKDHPEPTTLSAWLKDFEKFLASPDA